VSVLSACRVRVYLIKPRPHLCSGSTVAAKPATGAEARVAGQHQADRALISVRTDQGRRSGSAPSEARRDAKQDAGLHQSPDDEPPWFQMLGFTAFPGRYRSASV